MLPTDSKQSKSSQYERKATATSPGNPKTAESADEQTFRNIVAFFLTAAVLDTGTGDLPNTDRIINTPFARLPADTDLNVLASIDPVLYEQYRQYLANNKDEASSHLRHLVTFVIAGSAGTVWPGPEPHPKGTELAAAVGRLIP